MGKSRVYLFDASLRGAEHDDGVSGDQYHGGQSHEPADRLTPHRVHILAQSEGGHLNGTEGEHPLVTQKTRRTEVNTFTQ